MKRRTFLKSTSGLALTTLVTPFGIFQQKKSKAAVADLAAHFKTPPAYAKPHTWWHWMNGNVTKEGITLDLEAMKRIGLGGFQNFDAGTGIPKGPVEYLSPEWLELKKHAIQEAERLDLEFTMHNCPGWSSSGGPWITPDLAMHELTWSEEFLAAGEQAKNLTLPQPLTRLNYYRDIVVLAYPSLPGEAPLKNLLASLTTTDGKSATEEKQTFLQLEFKEPYEARSLTLLATPAEGGSPGPLLLQASNDGNTFTDVATLISGGGRFGGSDEETVVTTDFPATKAKFFRFISTKARQLTQIRFSNVPRLDDWKKRANFTYNGTAPAKLSANANEVAIPLDRILDITKHVDKNGNLNWLPPNQQTGWTILRLGYTPLGTLNRSAPDTGIGLECDKYSKAAMDFHFTKMMENLLPALQSLGAKGKVGMLIDSYEVGMQNWTPSFAEDFKQRNGYDLWKYLPAMTGRLVENADTTDRFLWDVRRTQGDLMADNYYGHFTELCHKNNIISYCQPYDRGPMDEMQIGSRIDINVGEFWNNLSAIFQNNWTMRRTVKLSAAIAHTNAQRVVAAESFTGEPESAKWQSYPFGLKTLGDKMFTHGLNRMVFHRFAHQPHPTARPGMTMGPWGIHLDRTNTWWEQGKAWMDYLTRCQYLLQEGLFVADLAYLTGEDAGVYANVTPEELSPTPPEGYDYDIIHAEAILKRAKIINNRLVLPDGMSYRLLILPPQETMTLALLRKLHELVNQGMILYGTKPTTTPGLKNNSPESQAEFKRLADELWGDTATTTNQKVGNGHIFWNQPLNTVLDTLAILPDFELSSRSGDAPITYIHRTIENTDVYFLANQRRTVEDIVCTFRVANKQPELWDAITGEIRQLGTYTSANGRTSVPIQLQPGGSIFVVFRNSDSAHRLTAVQKGDAILLNTTHFPKSTPTLYPNVINNFTISLWVKPEFHAMLSTNNFMENIKQPWTDFYCIYPPSGKALYGENHASCGLAVGRNGVAVWEREVGKPIFAMAAPVAISGWSHLALVYENGTPAVYVNGKLAGKGQPSKFNVHPGLGKAYLQDGASYFNGDRSEPLLYEEALSAERIVQLAAEKVPEFPSSTLAITATGAEKAGLLFWENGTYRLQYHAGKSSTINVSDIEQPLDLSTDWTVNFPPNLGAPTSIQLPKLLSLHQHPEAGVKYFSGTATYQKKFQLPVSHLKKGRRIFLDLGRVEMLAEIILNGKNLGIVWARPYQIDITEAALTGANELELKVTNLWPNRLIGDEQLPDVDEYTPGAGGSGFASLSGGGIVVLPDWYKEGKPKPENGRIAFATWKHYTKDSPLLESGLIGSVVIKTAVEQEI